MQRKISTVYLFFGLSMAWFIFSAFPSNPPNGFTGAPGEGTCISCHSTSNPDGLDGEIAFSGIPDVISPNTTYTITLTVSNPNSFATDAGFQWVALNESNLNAGTMNNASANSTITSANNRIYHEHNPAKDFGSETEVSWTVDWTAPSTVANNQTITFYAAGLVGNGGDGDNGDVTVTTSSSATLTDGETPLSVQISTIQNVSCNGGNDGQATAIPTNGQFPYQFNWSSGATTETASNLPAGIQTVTVTDNLGATTTTSVTITQPDPLQLTLINQVDIDCNNSLGTATVTVSGGTSGYNFQWSNGASGQTASNLPAGQNTVTVTDANGCQTTRTVLITTNDTPPIVEAGDNQSINCFTNSIILNGTAPNCSNCTFTWSTDIGNIVSGINTLNPTVDAGGVYTLTVIDNSNGCTNSDMMTVSADFIQPNVMIEESGALNCTTSEIQLSALLSNCANCTFNWSTTDGQITGATNAEIVTVSSAGTYTVSATNPNNGCVSTAQSNISEDTNVPTITINTPDVLNCNTSTITLSGETSNCTNCTFEWSTTSGSIISGINSLNALVNAPGLYSLLVSNIDNTCSTTTSITVLEDLAPSVELNIQSPIDCNGAANGLVDLEITNGQSPFTYNWSNGSTTENPGQLSAGTIALTLTDANNCIATVATMLSEPPVLLANASANNETAAGANDGMASVAPTGGTMPYVVEWSTGASSNTISNLAPGSYSVTITDDNGCMVSETVIINDFDCLLSANIETTDATCDSASDGQAAILLNDEAAPVSIEWSSGGTSLIETGLSAGTYTATITDNNNCSVISTAVIAEPEALFLNLSSIDETAAGSNDGMATAITTGGTPPYTFLWNTGDTSNIISNLAPGTYNLTVTDANDCTINNVISINSFDCNLEIPNFNLTANICPGSSEGMIELEDLIGATEPIQFFWSTGDTTSNINNLSAGTYSLTITDANNCTQTNTFEIEEEDTELPTISCPENIASNACSEIIDYALPIADDNCGIAALELIEGLESGAEFSEGITTISYRATDHAGNTVDCSFEISLVSDLSVIVSTTPVSCNGLNDGSISLDISGGTPPYSVENTMNGFSVGTYSFPLIDATGCEIEVQATIEEPEIISIEIDSITLETQQDMNGAIAITVLGGTPSYSYQWVLDDLVVSVEEDPTNLAAGAYLLIITDANGCFQSFDIEIERVTSTTELNLKETIRVFPNPSTGIVFIDTNIDASEFMEISLFEVSGKRIFYLEAVQAGNPIDLSELNNGVYILQIQKGQERKIEKIMISQ